VGDAKVSAHLSISEDGGTELAVRTAPQQPANAAQASNPSRHRISGLLGLGLILLIVFCTLYFALQYMI